MWQAMFAGVASLRAHQTRMNVIGNNISNVNTTAFKGGRAQFQDLMSQTIRPASRPDGARGGVNPMQVGLGVKVSSIDSLPNQGSLQLTGRETDLAIQGQGYFMFTDGSSTLYTRDGSLDIDSGGHLVHRATGMKALGWTSDLSGAIDTTAPIDAQSTISTPIGGMTAVRQTTRVVYGGNLDARAAPDQAWTATLNVYDSLGSAHPVTVTFRNQAAPANGPAPTGSVASWDWIAEEGGVPVGSHSTGNNGRLHFDGNGTLIGGQTQSVTVSPTNGATPFQVQLDFGAISRLATDSEVRPSSQDGFPPGSLEQMGIGIDGTITGVFSNGLTRAIGRMSVATFANPAGLERAGSSLWRATDNSGIGVAGTATQGGRGEINSGYLEQSNVDLGAEFSDLILTQRGFQANTRIVTVVDELLQEVVNLKR